jgi:pimeloyl-ACP methyl ester carboxylesterase
MNAIDQSESFNIIKPAAQSIRRCLQPAIFGGALLAAVGCSHQAVKPQPEASVQSTAAASAQVGAGLDPELKNYDYPRATQQFKFRSQNQDLQMTYILAEPAKPNGEVVVLMHGKNFSAAYWETTIRTLVDKGYRVVAPDQIGFGKSTKPMSYQFTFQTLAANTKALLDSLKIERASVIGHSMGGMLAARFALMYPAFTEKLIMVNPIGLEDWKTLVPYRTVDEHYQAELKATPESIREYQRTVYFDGQWKPEYDKLTEILSGWTKHPDYSRVAWNSALTTDMAFTQPVLYEFPLIKNETLLIIGVRDRTAVGKNWAPKPTAEKLGRYDLLGKKAARSIPKAKLIEIPKVGHMPQVEAFDKYMKAVLEFLPGGP